MVICYKFYSSTSFSFLFISFLYHDLFLFLCFCTFIWVQGALNNGNLVQVLFFYFILSKMIFFFCTFIWLQGDLKDNQTNVIFYFLLDSNLFYVFLIKANHFFSIIIHYLIPFIFLLLVQSHLFAIISFIFLWNIFFIK